MTHAENLRLECLKLAITEICNRDCKDFNDLQMQVRAAAENFYNFVTEQPTQSTSDPETSYGVSYIAEKPTGAVSREWLYDKLVKMLEVAKESRRRALISGNLTSHASCDGQCDALQWVIELINPKNPKKQ